MKDYEEVDDRFDKEFEKANLDSGFFNYFRDKIKDITHSEIERAGMDKARELAEKIKDILNTYNYLANVQEEIFKVIAEMENSK